MRQRKRFSLRWAKATASKFDSLSLILVSTGWRERINSPKLSLGLYR